MNAEERRDLRRQATLSVETMGPDAMAMLFSQDVLDFFDEIERLESKIEKLVEAGDALYHHGPETYLDEYKAWDAAKGDSK